MKQKIRNWPWPKGLMLITCISLGFTAYLWAASGGAADPQPQVKINSNGSVSIQFQGAPGSTYQIQSKTSFLTSNWTVEVGSVMAQSNLTVWVDNLPGATSKFYRIVPQTMAAVTPALVAIASTATTTLTHPGSQETEDTTQLITALNNGDNQTALNILGEYGISTNTLALMAHQLSQVPAQVQLQETFLKAATSLSLDGASSNVQSRLSIAASLGYGRPVWIARWLDTNWTARCDTELARATTAPIGALDVNLNDPDFIRLFQWYDRYAGQLHSVVLNWEHLSNHFIKPGYAGVNQELNALYKLIKARNPGAFVWVGVVNQDDASDVAWLQALTFKPDGLFVWNLRDFHSEFGRTRSRYLPVVGTNTPMVVAGFYGYKNAMRVAGKNLSAAKRVSDYTQRQAAKTAALSKLGGIGTLAEGNFSAQEKRLQDLGYRGLVAHWLLLEGIAQSNSNSTAGQ